MAGGGGGAGRAGVRPVWGVSEACGRRVGGVSAASERGRLRVGSALEGRISVRRVDQRSKAGSALERARARPCGPHARWRQWRRIPVRAPPGMARERLARVARVPADAAVIVLGGGLVGLLLDRPPDDVDQACERDLQGKHQPEESPGHGRRSYLYYGAMSRRFRLVWMCTQKVCVRGGRSRCLTCKTCQTVALTMAAACPACGACAR